jgi:hypothetical protein
MPQMNMIMLLLSKSEHGQGIATNVNSIHQSSSRAMILKREAGTTESISMRSEVLRAITRSEQGIVSFATGAVMFPSSRDGLCAVMCSQKVL